MKDGSSLAPLLQQTVSAALEYLDGQDTGSVASSASLEELRARLTLPLNEEPQAPEAVFAELTAGVEGGITRCSGGRFFGWVIGGTLPAALAADWMTSVWDQNSGTFVTAPAATVAEEVAGTWLKEVLGLPAAASFAFTTGCQAAHVTALAAARHAVLERCGWNVARKGLHGAPLVRVVTSTERHTTLLRAVRLLGLGEDNVIALPANAMGKLEPETLRAELAREAAAPTIVVLQAGDVNIGEFDDFAALVPLAHEFGAWVHVDGAFGLWANASPKLRHLLRGAEAADSWATDGHKWLNVPYDCGYAFVADATAHRASFAINSAYVEQTDDVRNQVDWNIEFSRRARGFPTWAALRQLGRSGVAAMVERCCAFAAELGERIGALPQAELLYAPVPLNQALVRFLDPNGANHDAFTDRVVAGILATGEAYFTTTTWRGMRAMRISVSGHATTANDVERSVRAVETVLKGLGC